MFWTFVFEIYKVGNMYCPMDSICMGRWILIFISYSLPKNKMRSDVYTFSIASISQIRDPFQSFCLPTHDYSFQLKSTLFLFVAFCLRFNEGTKNMTMELDPYILISI